MLDNDVGAEKEYPYINKFLNKYFEMCKVLKMPFNGLDKAKLFLAMKNTSSEEIFKACEEYETIDEQIQKVQDLIYNGKTESIKIIAEMKSLIDQYEGKYVTLEDGSLMYNKDGKIR